MPTAVVPSLESMALAVEQLCTTHQDFRALRDEALVLRTRVQYQRHECLHRRARVLKSMEQLAAAVEQTGSSPPSTDLPLLTKDLQELAEDHIKLDDTERALSGVEYRMQREEDKLASHAAKAVQTIRELNAGPVDDLEMLSALSATRHQQPHAGRSSAAHPLLEEYYDKQGTVKVMQERLHDLMYEHHELRTIRGLQEDQGCVLGISESDFEATCEQDLARATQEINHAIETAQYARRDCVAAGLDPDHHREEGCTEPEISPTVAILESEGFLEPPLDSDVPFARTSMEASLLSVPSPALESSTLPIYSLSHRSNIGSARAMSPDSILEDRQLLRSRVESWIQDSETADAVADSTSAHIRQSGSQPDVFEQPVPIRIYNGRPSEPNRSASACAIPTCQRTKISVSLRKRQSSDSDLNYAFWQPAGRIMTPSSD